MVLDLELIYPHPHDHIVQVLSIVGENSFWEAVATDSLFLDLGQLLLLRWGTKQPQSI